MKKCSKCKIEKPLDEFYVKEGGAQGRHAACRECTKAARARYYAANKDVCLERMRRYYADNRDARQEHQRRYHSTAAGRAAMVNGRHRRRARIAAAVPQRWRKSESPESLCYWCGCDLAETVTHVEHLMPISLGGPAEAYNEAPACKACNLAKSDTHPLVWLAHQF